MNLCHFRVFSVLGDTLRTQLSWKKKKKCSLYTAVDRYGLGRETFPEWSGLNHCCFRTLLVN